MYLTHALRAISRGIAVVTDPFFKYVSLLLTGNSPVNTFVTDASTNNFAVSIVGDTKPNSLSPFTPTDGTYGSAFFDGTGDYLTVPDNTALNVSTGDFTVECWFYISSTPSVTRPILGRLASNVFARSDLQYLISYLSTGSVIVTPYSGTTNYDMTFTSVSINAWHHVALVRTGNNFYAYLDGNRSATTRTISGSLNTSSWLTYSGIYTEGGTSYYNHGYVSNIRIVKGTALYTNSTYTVPTAPLTAITNTSLLTLQTNQAINNNLFIDDSTNNFAVTRVGNTTQGTFTPYGSNWSNYFDNTGDFLTAPANTNLSLGTGNFTIEAWVYNVGGFSTDPIIECRSNSASTGGYAFLVRSTGKLSVYTNTGSGEGFLADSVGTLVTDRWYHVALVRAGTGSSQSTFYIDGVASGSFTFPNNLTDGLTNTTKIGGSTSTSECWSGYISNARIVKGTAVYTAAFTPPTAPLTAISGTSLLTCADNRFIDDSTNNFAITKNGDVSVQRFSPFSPSASYSSSVIGGSGYFDGAGDNLNFANNTAFSQNTVFTFECWVYPTAITAGGSYMWSQLTSGYLGFAITTAGKFVVDKAYIGVMITSTDTYTVNSWYHFAVCYDGTTTRLFVNGTLQGSVSGGGAASATTSHVGFYNGAGAFSGYISNLRIVKGTAVYTANFTPPTAPVTAITNTSLLLNFTNAGIIDNAMMNDLETVGNAQISTAQSKFGGGSMYFAGGSDYLTVPSNVNLELGSGDFTIEAWIYLNARVADSAIISKGTNGAYLIYFGAGGELAFYASTNGSSWTTANLTISTLPSLSTWHHIAIVRSGNVVNTYFNGTFVQNAAMTGSLISQPSVPLLVSRFANSMNGYIDDLRITKGYARYTANFTPPTAALPTS